MARKKHDEIDELPFKSEAKIDFFFKNHTFLSGIGKFFSMVSFFLLFSGIYGKLKPIISPIFRNPFAQGDNIQNNIQWWIPETIIGIVVIMFFGAMGLYFFRLAKYYRDLNKIH